MVVVELVWFGIVVREYDGAVCIVGITKDLCNSFRYSLQVFAVPFALRDV